MSTLILAQGTGRSGTTLPPPPSGSGTLLAAFSATSDGFATKNGITLSNGFFFDLSSAISYDGTLSYRARRSDNTNTQLNFSGTAIQGLDELYISWRMYMPDGTENPSIGNAVATPGPDNDKFLRVFTPNNTTPGDDEYVNHMGASYRNGEIFAEYTWQNPANDLERFGIGAAGSKTQAPDTNARFYLIGNPAYLGRWVQIRIRVKPATVAAGNGIFQMWADGVLVMNRTAISNYLFPSRGDATRFFDNGYILGAMNNGAVPGEYFYLDDVRFSTGGFA